MGFVNNCEVYAVYDYMAENDDELSFQSGDKLKVIRKGDDCEKEWWWSRLGSKEGYAPRNLLGVSFKFSYAIQIILDHNCYSHINIYNQLIECWRVYYMYDDFFVFCSFIPVLYRNMKRTSGRQK